MEISFAAIWALVFLEGWSALLVAGAALLPLIVTLSFTAIGSIAFGVLTPSDMTWAGALQSIEHLSLLLS